MPVPIGDAVYDVIDAAKRRAREDGSCWFCGKKPEERCEHCDTLVSRHQDAYQKAFGAAKE